MSKKLSIIVISLIILMSLVLSIYIPNREKIDENNYFLIEENGKFGIKQNEETVIQPQYDEIIIPNQHKDVFLCRNAEEKNFVNKKNQEIFTQYNNVELIEISDSIYEKNILTYEENGKYGLLGIDGKTITEAQYEEIYNSGYKESEVVVSENGKYGVIDEKGKIKIKINYEAIISDEYHTEENGYQKSGYIVQQKTTEGYRYGYYDSEGIQVLKDEYNRIERIIEIQSNDIYLIAARNGQEGVFINNSEVINTKYQEIDYNPELEIFIVERTGMFGAVNLNGIEIIKPEYSEIQINGIYIYTVNGDEKKVWDTRGKEVDISFDAVVQKTDSQYFIKSEAGNYSILNSNFETISKQNYKYLEYAYNDCFISSLSIWIPLFLALV